MTFIIIVLTCGSIMRCPKLSNVSGVNILREFVSNSRHLDLQRVCQGGSQSAKMIPDPVNLANPVNPAHNSERPDFNDFSRTFGPSANDWVSFLVHHGVIFGSS